MSFNLDPSKQAQDVNFFRKLSKPIIHQSLNFNNSIVTQSTIHKHLGMILDTKLDFQEQLKINLVRSARQLDYEESYAKN